MEDDLDARQLVRVVTEEEEAIVSIQMVMQHLHNCFNNHFNHIGLLDQLSGLKEVKKQVKKGTKTEMRDLMMV